MSAPAAPTPRGLGGGGKTGQDRAECGRDQAEQGQRSDRDLAQHSGQRVHAFLERDRRPEFRIVEGARHQIDDVETGQQKSRAEGRCIEVGDRYP